MTTWRIAPAPMPKQSAAKWGLTAWLPAHTPITAGRPERGEDGERGAGLGDRGCDPEALGDVVDDEANDEEAGQRRSTGGERGTHDQSLAEIVQPNAERDEAGERNATWRRAAPSAEAEKIAKPGDAGRKGRPAPGPQR